MRQAVANGARNNRFAAPLFRRVRTAQMIRGGPGSEYFWLFKLAVPGTRALDVGANVGQTSSVLGKRIGADGEVLALEPNPRCFRELRLGSQLPIIPLQVAAGSTFGEAVLSVPIGSEGARQEQLRTLLDRELTSGKGYDRLTVPVIPLDSVLAWAHLPTTIVKIDVEGYELAVIEGAIETITTHRPALVVEIEEQHQPAGQSIDDVFGRISDLGYVVFAIGSAGPFPISRFDLREHQRAYLAEPAQHCYVNNFIGIHRNDAARRVQVSELGDDHEQ
jgi:FkbM family methyltransferase